MGKTGTTLRTLDTVNEEDETPLLKIQRVDVKTGKVQTSISVTRKEAPFVIESLARFLKAPRDGFEELVD